MQNSFLILLDKISSGSSLTQPEKKIGMVKSGNTLSYPYVIG